MLTPAKQPRLDFQQKVSTKVELNKLVAAYNVEKRFPVLAVESLSFGNIWSTDNEELTALIRQENFCRLPGPVL